VRGAWWFLSALGACAGGRSTPSATPSSASASATFAATKSSAPPTPLSSSSTSAAPEPTCTNEIPADAKSPVVITSEFFEPDFVPGDARDLQLGVRNPPGPFSFYRHLDLCATWTVAPPGLATIDDHGHLVIGAAAAGKTLIVTAKLAGGYETTRSLDVAPADVAPLVGNWHEDGRQGCGSTTWELPSQPQKIGELHVTAAGHFAVTWTPFETYVDYTGTYTYDAKSSVLVLKVDGGNYVPKDIRPKGTAKVEEGKLVLRGIWLGSNPEGGGPPACAQRFEK
jgi:hypothetical protein